jgi:hypothetical protein
MSLTLLDIFRSCGVGAFPRRPPINLRSYALNISLLPILDAPRPGRPLRAKKIILVGAASPGKTFAHDRLQQNSEATIGTALISKAVSVGNAEVKLEIWDAEQYKSLAPMSYRDTRGRHLLRHHKRVAVRVLRVRTAV